MLYYDIRSVIRNDLWRSHHQTAQRRRISQRQLAEELNVSFTSVNRWENGKTMPNKMTVFVIRKYCEEHGLDFSYDEGCGHELQNDD